MLIEEFSLQEMHDLAFVCMLSLYNVLYEPRREKTGFLPMRKQRRRSASQ